MAYTPELSFESSCTLRRLAWAMEIPMTTAIQEVIAFLPAMISSKKVCEKCKDKTKCQNCAFNKRKDKYGKDIFKSVSGDKIPG